MRIIETIKSELDKIPGIKYHTEHDTISVLPAHENGFKVSFVYNGPDDCHISGDDWKMSPDYFSNEVEALGIFFGCLSLGYRLKIGTLNGKKCYWEIEQYVNGKWSADYSHREWASLFLLFSFWRKKEVVKYYQNEFLQQIPDGSIIYSWF